jgi:uncharacterized phiE125 gp8 family phage protein
MSNLLKTPNQRDVVRAYGVTVADTADEVVSVQEAKDYAKIGYSTEDSIVQMLVDGAKKAFEDYTGKLIFQREVTAKYDCKEYKNLLYLPWLPVASITSVVEVEDDGTETTIDSDDYKLFDYKLEVDRFNIVKVTYQAGITDGTVPPDLKLGILKWITSNYNDREDTVIEQINMMPNGSCHHWNRYKTQRL